MWPINEASSQEPSSEATRAWRQQNSHLWPISAVNFVGNSSCVSAMRNALVFRALSSAGSARRCIIRSAVTGLQRLQCSAKANYPSPRLWRSADGARQAHLSMVAAWVGSCEELKRNFGRRHHCFLPLSVARFKGPSQRTVMRGSKAVKWLDK